MSSCPGILDNDEDGFAQDVYSDDNNPPVYPGQIEALYNWIDGDCNFATLDDNLDQDGFALMDDCDDANASI